MMRISRFTTRLTLLTLVMTLADFVLCGCDGTSHRCLAEEKGSLSESKLPANFVSAPSGRPVQRRIEFNSDIRPILSDNCFFCHGPDRNKRQADLRLDTKEGLFASSGALPAVTPEKPEESELYRRIVSKDPEHQMPPADSGKVLSEQQIELLKQWIEQGAEFQGHWAFLPIRSVTSSSSAAQPEKSSDVSGDAAAAVIDELIADKLQQQKLVYSPEADRVTLIRRLSFDLLGLPPAVEDVNRFVNDSSESAYEKLVDSLLASPHFGERMAVWWLDLARYADTVGYHGDQEMSVSPFREYVIRSFNQNKPFDQFTKEQLAGDLFPSPNREQLIASGYNRLGMMSAEGGVQDKEYLAKYIAERVRNASGTWLGITLGCAECHDHKFDPFTSRDFYRFEAFFADIRERGLYSGADANGAWGPSIKVPDTSQEARLQELTTQIAETKTILETETDEIAAARTEWIRRQTGWTVLKPDQLITESGATLTMSDDGSVLATGTASPHDVYTLRLNAVPSGVTAFRLEVLPHDSLPKKGPGRAENGNFVLTEFQVTQTAAEQTSGDKKIATENAAPESDGVQFRHASATFEQASENPAADVTKGIYSVFKSIDRDATGGTRGWAIADKSGEAHVAVFETNEPLKSSSDSELVIRLIQKDQVAGHTIGRFRLSVTTSTSSIQASPALPVSIEMALSVPESERTSAQQTELIAYYRTVAPLLAETRNTLASLEKTRAELDATIPVSLITESVPPRMVRILRRGNWMDESGEAVTPGFPESINAVMQAVPADTTANSDRALNRLDLAQWIMSAENPLTSRVIVNRLWKVFFGAGLSRKLDDLGAQGESPSHPELLDYLSGHLIQDQWDLKSLMKSIVMSRAYRQASTADANLKETDPYNRWLARQGRFRLDAEFVRDNALAVSGLLVNRTGGRSVRPYQPPGYWAYLNFPTREWQNSSGEDLYRRGLYTHWQRQYLHPSLLAFDAPSREECTADRARSNTPLQSLVLLNDPIYVEAARVFAALILHQKANDTDVRLDFAFRRCLSRPIRQEESDLLRDILEKHRAEYAADPKAAAEVLSVGAHAASADLDPAELAAWTSVARIILNLHETITRN
jgi:hypothetical protein